MRIQMQVIININIASNVDLTTLVILTNTCYHNRDLIKTQSHIYQKIKQFVGTLKSMERQIKNKHLWKLNYNFSRKYSLRKKIKVIVVEMLL